MSDAIRFAIQTADGRRFVGPVHGAGGVLGGRPHHALARLRADAERATNDPGHRLSVYEPAPGHCRIYPDYSAAGNGEPADVPLAGAQVELAWSAARAGRRRSA